MHRILGALLLYLAAVTGAFAQTQANIEIVPGTPNMLCLSLGPSCTELGGFPTNGLFTPFANQITNVISTSETLPAAQRGFFVSLTNSSSSILTLSSVSYAAGFYVDLQNTGSGAWVLTPTTGTINGGSTLSLASGQGVHLVFDGTNYQALTGFTTASAGVSSIGGLTGAVTLSVADGLTATPSGSNIALALPTVQQASHHTFTNPNAFINRLTDRIFMASAADNDGTSTCPNGDWLSQVASGIGEGCQILFAQSIVEYDPSNPSASEAVPQVGFIAAVQSVNAPTDATPEAINFYTYNNSTVGNPSAWGIYGESHYFTGTSQTFGFELEVRAEGSVTTSWTPFDQPSPSIIAQVYGCGAGLSASHNCTVAEYITANPQQFGAGVIFLAGSLCQCATGGTTTGAIMMPDPYQIQWYTAGTSIAASISSDSSGNFDVDTNGTGGHLMVNGHQVFCGSGATVAC